MQAPQILLLDADGVIQNPHQKRRESFGRLCGIGNTKQFLEDVFLVEEFYLTGKLNFPDALGNILKKWDREASLEEALYAWTQIKPDEKIFNVIDQLRSNGASVLLASNQERYRANYMTRNVGYIDRVDALYYSIPVNWDLQNLALGISKQ